MPGRLVKSVGPMPSTRRDSVKDGQTTFDAFAAEADTTEPSVDLLGLLARRKWLIVMCGLLGVGLGYLYAVRAPVRYQSTAEVLVVHKEPKLPVDEMGYKTGLEDNLATHVRLLGSPLIVENAIKKYGLASLPSFAEVQNAGAAVALGLEVCATRDNADVIQISYTGSIPGDCPKVVEAVVNAYQDFLGEAYQDVGTETVDLITKAKDELSEQLTKKERAYEEFQKSSPLISDGQSTTNVFHERLDDIERARSEILLKRSQTSATVAAIEDALTRGSNREALRLMLQQTLRDEPVGDDAPGSKSLSGQLLVKQIDEKMLLGEFGPDHPRVKALHSEIELMKRLVSEQAVENEQAKPPEVDFFQVYLESLRESLKADEERERHLDKLFTEQQNQAKSLRQFLVEDERHRKDIGRTEAIFETVLKRLEEINLLQAKGSMKTQTIAAPGLGFQVEPRVPAILAVAGVLGLFIGFGLAWLAEHSDKSFKGPDEIRQQVGRSVIGHIPIIDPAESKRRKGRVASGPPSPLDPMLVAFHRPRSTVAESFRVVRTALYFGTQGHGHRVIQVTSADPGDGKTTLSTNLAISIAQSGKRVLLVDADFRRPRLEALFGIDNDLGLSTVLTGEMELPDAVHSTEVENLWALPVGKRPHNPSELLSSPRFGELLGVLREQYDFVIVDTPPVLVVTDPSAVASCVDGVLLAMRLHKNSRDSLLRATELLASLGANVLGVVVNGVGTKSPYGHGRSGYDYSYYGAQGAYGYDQYYGGGAYYVDEDESVDEPVVEKRNGDK